MTVSVYSSGKKGTGNKFNVNEKVSSHLDPERCTNHHKTLALTNIELCMSVRHALLL